MLTPGPQHCLTHAKRLCAHSSPRPASLLTVFQSCSCVTRVPSPKPRNSEPNNRTTPQCLFLADIICCSFIGVGLSGLLCSWRAINFNRTQSGFSEGGRLAEVPFDGRAESCTFYCTTQSLHQHTRWLCPLVSRTCKCWCFSQLRLTVANAGTAEIKPSLVARC